VKSICSPFSIILCCWLSQWLLQKRKCLVTQRRAKVIPVNLIAKLMSFMLSVVSVICWAVCRCSCRMKDNQQQFVVVVQTVIFPVNFELSCLRNWIELVILVYLQKTEGIVHVSVRSFMSSICSSTTQQYLIQYKTFVEAPNPLLNSETEVLLYMHACTVCVCVICWCEWWTLMLVFSGTRAQLVRSGRVASCPTEAGWARRWLKQTNDSRRAGQN